MCHCVIIPSNNTQQLSFDTLLRPYHDKRMVIKTFISSQVNNYINRQKVYKMQN